MQLTRKRDLSGLLGRLARWDGLENEEKHNHSKVREVIVTSKGRSASAPRLDWEDLYEEVGNKKSTADTDGPIKLTNNGVWISLQVATIELRDDNRIDLDSGQSFNFSQDRDRHEEDEETRVETVPHSRDEVGDE